MIAHFNPLARFVDSTLLLHTKEGASHRPIHKDVGSKDYHYAGPDEPCLCEGAQHEQNQDEATAYVDRRPADRPYIQPLVVSPLGVVESSSNSLFELVELTLTVGQDTRSVCIGLSRGLNQGRVSCVPLPVVSSSQPLSRCSASPSYPYLREGRYIALWGGERARLGECLSSPMPTLLMPNRETRQAWTTEPNSRRQEP